MTTTLQRSLCGLALLLCLGPGEVFARTPTEQIQETIQQVLEVVSAPSNGAEAERKELLRDALMPRFDWTEMAMRALGKHWNSIGSRRDEFIAAFAEFLSNSYFGKIGSYKDEKILFVRESIENNQAQVNTKIIPGKGEPTSVNYRLHQVQGEWKIYDVVVEDISLMANFRSQFNRILAKGSFDDLLRQLKEKDAKSRK
jgi:phospholipid transport system substrate-binding protein